MLGWLFGKQEIQEFTEQEEKDFFEGYRLGFPLEGQPPVVVNDPFSSEFRRGLEAGQKQFNKAGQPRIKYD